MKSIRASQTRLASLGYYVGPVDGKMGPLTQDALVQFQNINGLAVTGALDKATSRLLKQADAYAASGYYVPAAVPVQPPVRYSYYRPATHPTVYPVAYNTGYYHAYQPVAYHTNVAAVPAAPVPVVPTRVTSWGWQK